MHRVQRAGSIVRRDGRGQDHGPATSSSPHGQVDQRDQFESSNRDERFARQLQARRHQESNEARQREILELVLSIVERREEQEIPRKCECIKCRFSLILI